jgi:hypothetical protein
VYEEAPGCRSGPCVCICNSTSDAEGGIVWHPMEAPLGPVIRRAVWWAGGATLVGRGNDPRRLQVLGRLDSPSVPSGPSTKGTYLPQGSKGPPGFRRGRGLKVRWMTRRAACVCPYQQPRLARRGEDDGHGIRRARTSGCRGQTVARGACMTSHEGQGEPLLPPSRGRVSPSASL